MRVAISSTTDKDFLSVLKAGSPAQRRQHTGFVLRPLSLAVDGRLLPVSSCGLRTCLCPNLLRGHESHWGRAHPTNFIFNLIRALSSDRALF